MIDRSQKRGVSSSFSLRRVTVFEKPSLSLSLSFPPYIFCIYFLEEGMDVYRNFSDYISDHFLGWGEGGGFLFLESKFCIL